LACHDAFWQSLHLTLLASPSKLEAPFVSRAVTPGLDTWHSSESDINLSRRPQARFQHIAQGRAAEKGFGHEDENI
jgi:hypothetical protein